MGSTIGRLLKIDACTSAALRGRYARLCVELPLDKLVKPFVIIGSHKQQILYEGDDLLSKNCGHLGHPSRQYNRWEDKPSQGKPSISPTPQQNTVQNEENNGWKTVSFGKGKKKVANSPIHDSSIGINVNIFDAGTGKYLTSQKLTYKNKKSLTNAPNTHPKPTIPMENYNGNMKTKNNFHLLQETDTILEKIAYNTNNLLNKKNIIYLCLIT